MTNLSHTTFVGKAGEHIVTGQLLLRGISVHIPVVDTGIDLIAGDNVRIQVKTRLQESGSSTGYCFTLGTKRETHASRDRKSRAKVMADSMPNVDFLICYGARTNRFWVIPAAVLQEYPGIQSLLLGCERRNVVDTERLHQLHQDGMRQCDIAQVMGIHPVTVSEHVRGRMVTEKKSMFRKLALACEKYENAWHEIEAAVRLTHEIDLNDAVRDTVEEKV